MPNAKPWFLRPRFLLPAVMVLVLVVAGAYFGLTRALGAPAQPFPYDHSAHVQNGVPCLFCHPGALYGKSAGLPTLQKCQGCHNNLGASKPGLQAWADYARQHAQVEWVPVAIQPDFVYFSHRPHITAGLNCEQCHGDVGQMKAAEPQKNQNMGWCLDCHKRLAPDKAVKLTDCITCHK
jgi:hypothetical protein